MCSLGHIGALCETCDLYNIRGSGQFASAGNFQCLNCDELIGNNTLIVAIISIISLAFIAFSVRSSMKVNDELQKFYLETY